MRILAQHAYGKSDKIETGMRSGHLSGAVLNPRGESPETLRATATSLRHQFGGDVSLLFDSHFHLCTIVPENCEQTIAQYQYFSPGLTRGDFVSPSSLREYVDSVLGFQLDLHRHVGLERLLGPSVVVESFGGPWAHIAEMLAVQSMESHSHLTDAPPLLLTLVLSETALQSQTGVDELLDVATKHNETAGFYIVFACREQAYPAVCAEDALASLLYAVYVLAEVNRFEVICGYSDFFGLLLLAVGANAISTGWYNSSRQFCPQTFLPRTGGKPRRPRYTSRHLFNSILVSELDFIAQNPNLDVADFLSNTSFDAVLNPSPLATPWRPRESALHHWEVLSSLICALASVPDVKSRVAHLAHMIDDSIALYGLLNSLGVVFDHNTGPAVLRTYRTSIDRFEERTL